MEAERAANDSDFGRCVVVEIFDEIGLVSGTIEEGVGNSAVIDSVFIENKYESDLKPVDRCLMVF